MIEHITRDTFQNISNLRNLHMSHNKISVLLSDTFYHVPLLQYLDLSYTNTFEYSSMSTLEAIKTLLYGLRIQQTTFKYLANIMYLDLSHTKITRDSAVAFSHLTEKLKFMSLCYTAFPMIGKLFRNTALVGLDLSGNAAAAFNILDDAFEGVSELKVLYFELSNLKNISWLKSLTNLQVLGVAGNNINVVSYDIFSTLSKLVVLDLSVNHVGNWYNRVFTNNKNLRILNLRDNNINIITSEMLKDFSLLDYLSLGDNNFVCDCLLRDLVDIAEYNNKNSDCTRHMIVDVMKNKGNSRISSNKDQNEIPMGTMNISSIIASHIFRRIRMKIDLSNSNVQRANKTRTRFILNHRKNTTTSCSSAEPEANSIVSKLNESSLKFQLLDYEDDHYWCFNETEKLNLIDLKCHQRSFLGDIVQQLSDLTFYAIVSAGTLLGLSLIGLIVYIKRWHIYYYYSSIKSAVLMSEAVKENLDKANSYESGVPNTYDIFISYCQNDRDWVLNELIPNVEESEQISICLHERDFQVGISH